MRLIQVLFKLLPDRDDMPDVLVIHLLALSKLRQLSGHRDGIPDVASVEHHLGQVIQVILQVVEIHRVRVRLPERLEEVAPDLAAVRLAQRRVAQRELDARLERLVKGAHAVRRQDQDAVVIFEHAEEDGHQRVAVQVGERALFQKDVGFVQEHDAAPDFANVEDRFEIVLDTLRVCSDVAARHAVKGPLHELGDALGCEGLACAGRAVEENERAVSLALHEIGRPVFGVDDLHGGLDEFLGDGIEHQAVESDCVPGDWPDVIDEQRFFFCACVLRDANSGMKAGKERDSRHFLSWIEKPLILDGKTSCNPLPGGSSFIMSSSLIGDAASSKSSVNSSASGWSLRYVS